MHLSMVIPTHPTSGYPRSQGGDCPASRSPRGGALLMPVEVFFRCQTLGWCSPPVGWGFAPKLCPRSGESASAKWQSPLLTSGVSRWGRWGRQLIVAIFVLAVAEMHSFGQKGESPAERNKPKRRSDSHLLRNSSGTVPDIPTSTKAAKHLCWELKDSLSTDPHRSGKAPAYE